MPTIYSTLSNDRTFPLYEKAVEGSVVTKAKYKSAILIKGGANVSDKHFQTKAIVETEVTAEELKLLQDNASFKRLEKRGFLSSKRPVSPKKDAAAPKTKKELQDKAGKKGVAVELNTQEAEL
jgi:hypothetical protein